MYARLEQDVSKLSEHLDSVLRLESLKEMVALVPSSCKRVRNLFQFLLFEALGRLDHLASSSKVPLESLDNLKPLKTALKDYSDLRLKF